jgi:hypothetical protein
LKARIESAASAFTALRPRVRNLPPPDEAVKVVGDLLFGMRDITGEPIGAGEVLWARDRAHLGSRRVKKTEPADAPSRRLLMVIAQEPT